MIDAQDLLENELKIKNLCMEMLMLAVADIGAHRGGANMKSWAVSAKRWISDIRPGDEKYPTTFAGCCSVLGYCAEAVKSRLLSNPVSPIRKIMSRPKHTQNKVYPKTWWFAMSSKKWICEYCGSDIPAKSMHYHRAVSGGMSHACLTCGQKDHGPLTRFNGRKKDQTEKRVKGASWRVNENSDNRASAGAQK